MEEKLPIWVTERHTIDEPAFCEYFAKEYGISCMNGLFYNFEGAIEENALRTVIYDTVSPFVKSRVATSVNSIMETLKLHSYREPCAPETKRIHVNNGIVLVDGDVGKAPTFIPEIDYCRNRLNIDYNPELWNGSYFPPNFLKFLYELLDSDEVQTLQEYLGYLMIASTKGQAMLSIIGSGGEGKSRIGVVLKEIFKNNMIIGNYQRIENDRFFRYNLLNKLVLMDDDMQMTALNSTGLLKTLITSEIPIDIEAKGKQSYQEYLYARLITFGNGSPTALYDHSVGFARRLIVLTAKQRPQDRVDDPFIADKFIAEKDRIFCWMLDGLRSLLNHNYRFTTSQKSKDILNEMMNGYCNIPDFLRDRDSVILDKEGTVTSKALYEMYGKWCDKNGLEPFKRRAFTKWIMDNSEKYHVTYSTNIPCGSTHVRGFKGIKLSGFIK